MPAPGVLHNSVRLLELPFRSQLFGAVRVDLDSRVHGRMYTSNDFCFVNIQLLSTHHHHRRSLLHTYFLPS